MEIFLREIGKTSIMFSGSEPALFFASAGRALFQFFGLINIFNVFLFFNFLFGFSLKYKTPHPSKKNAQHANICLLQ